MLWKWNRVRTEASTLVKTQGTANRPKGRANNWCPQQNIDSIVAPSGRDGVSKHLLFSKMPKSLPGEGSQLQTVLILYKKISTWKRNLLRLSETGKFSIGWMPPFALVGVETLEPFMFGTKVITPFSRAAWRSAHLCKEAGRLVSIKRGRDQNWSL